MSTRAIVDTSRRFYVICPVTNHRYGALETTIEKGLQQTWRYMDRCGANQGHLVIFDRDENQSWKDKIFKKQRAYEGDPIIVWGNVVKWLVAV